MSVDLDIKVRRKVRIVGLVVISDNGVINFILIIRYKAPNIDKAMNGARRRGTDWFVYLTVFFSIQLSIGELMKINFKIVLFVLQLWLNICLSINCHNLVGSHSLYRIKVK